MTNHGELKVWGVSQTPLVVTKEHIKNAVTPVTSIHIAVCGTCCNLRCLQPLPYPCGAMCVLLRAASCQPSCASILAQAQSATKEAPEGAVTAKRAAATTCSNAGCQRSAGWYHIGCQQHGLRLSNCVPLLATTSAHTTPRETGTHTHAHVVRPSLLACSSPVLSATAAIGSVSASTVVARAGGPTPDRYLRGHATPHFPLHTRPPPTRPPRRRGAAA